MAKFEPHLAHFSQPNMPNERIDTSGIVDS